MSDLMNYYEAGDKVICVDDTDFNKKLVHLFPEKVHSGWTYVVERVRVNTCSPVEAVVDLRGITADLTCDGWLPGWSIHRFRKVGPVPSKEKL